MIALLRSCKRRTLSRGLFLLLLAALCAGTARAQAPNWQLEATIGSIAPVSASATDAAGNVYLTGVFSGTITLGNTTLSCPYLADIYVAKWSPTSRTFLWAQQAGSRGNEGVTAIAVNGSNVYVTGWYNTSAATFGSITLPVPSSGPYGPSDDMFVAKLTDAGSSASFTWVQHSTGTGGEHAQAMAIAGNQVYVGGSFASFGYTAQFGGTTLIKASTASGFGFGDCFVTKIIDNGSSANFAWAVRAGGVYSDDIGGLAVSGNAVYAVGAFASPTADFGSTVLTNGAGNYVDDAFITRITDNGSSATFAWTMGIGGSGSKTVNDVVTQGGHLYLAGSFAGSATFGSTTLTSPGSSDMFLAKLTDTGTGGSYTWVQQLGADGGIGNLQVRGPHLLISGGYRGSPITLGSTTLANAGMSDVFVAKFTEMGNSLRADWALSGGGSGTDVITSLVLSSSTAYVTGSVNPPARFGTHTFSGSAPDMLGFIMSLAEPALSAAPAAWTAALNVFPNPAHAQVTVRLPAGTVQPSATLALIDALGRIVLTQPVPPTADGATATLSLRGLPPGIYRLRVQTGTQVAYRAITVQ